MQMASLSTAGPLTVLIQHAQSHERCMQKDERTSLNTRYSRTRLVVDLVSRPYHTLQVPYTSQRTCLPGHVPVVTCMQNNH